MVNLPFLKKRKAPRMQEPKPERLVNGSPDEMLEDQMIDELMDAAHDKDPSKFRHALEALIMNSFDYSEEK
jgi:hypothetical protein